MPRSNTGLTSLLSNPATEAHSTLVIHPIGGDVYYSTVAVTDSGAGHTFTPYLKAVGEMKQSLLRATDRVSVTLFNDDYLRGYEVANGVRAFNNVDAEIGRYFYNATDGPAFRTLFKGKIVVPVATEREVKFDVIDPIAAAGLVLAARPMSVKCPYRFKDARTCTYSGGETVCNKSQDSVDGCLGRTNTAHFGGWFFPYTRIAAAPVGGGDGGIDHNPCFVPGTLITMADGRRRPIEDIRVGDRVACFYYDAVKDVDVVVTEEVEAVFEHQSYDYYNYGFDSGNTLGVTAEHPLYVGKGAFRIADYARLKHRFNTLDYKRRELRRNTLTSAAWITGPVTVYNFHVRFFNTYFANGVAVHNRKPDDPPLDAY